MSDRRDEAAGSGGEQPQIEPRRVRGPAPAWLRTGRPALHRFTLTADEASEEGMVCGGTMEIFLDVWEGDDGR